jgi:hypothetical protein
MVYLVCSVIEADTNALKATSNVAYPATIMGLVLSAANRLGHQAGRQDARTLDPCRRNRNSQIPVLPLAAISKRMAGKNKYCRSGRPAYPAIKTIAF